MTKINLPWFLRKRKKGNALRKEKEKNPTQASYCLVKNLLFSVGLSKSTVCYAEHVVTLQTSTRINKLKKNLRTYSKGNKLLNTSINKNFRSMLRIRKEGKLQYFQELQISDDESKTGVTPAWQKLQKSRKSCPPVLNEIKAQTENYLLHV